MTAEEELVRDVLEEDARRNRAINAVFNPVSGEGSVGERERVEIADFPLRAQWLPVPMLRVPLVRQIVEAGSISRFLTDCLGAEDTAEERAKVIEQLCRIRNRHDFPFWAATLAYIKNKAGGEDVLFRLTLPQRRFVSRLEELRLGGKPIRLILLKARQWGGSTTSQLYMAWLQLTQRTGLNSLIIAHQGAGSDEIKDMFDRMMRSYPVWALHGLGESYDEREDKLVGVGKSGNIWRVPQRNCKIKIGTAQHPDGCRGGDYSLVHLSEVGIWCATDGKKPEDIVRSACAGVMLRPYTMIVYESTANGTGNYFHKEYKAAKSGDSQFEAMFVSWFDIPAYTLPIEDKAAFARRLVSRRLDDNVDNDRSESGKYLWWLWGKGATLEAIHWYVEERKKYNDHGQMAAEFPSDDVEAFVHSGSRVFDKYLVDRLYRTCVPPRYKGDVTGRSADGAGALEELHFSTDGQGLLWVWEKPETDGGEEDRVANRYLVVVDVGGRGSKADWSVVCVMDRLFMMDGGKPCIVAQWRGHTDIDLLAWKAAQIAAWYDNALLVIESNTVETHDPYRGVDGGAALYILNQIGDVYRNMYTRAASDEQIRKGAPPRVYGFHTNTKTKPELVHGLVRSVREDLWTERDRRCVDELMDYEQKPNGSYGAIVGSHDDMLMTRAIALRVCYSEMPPPRVVRRDMMPAVSQRIVSEATI